VARGHPRANIRAPDIRAGHPVRWRAMRTLALLLLVCAACAKKPAPKAPAPPPTTEQSDEKKPPDTTPVQRTGDPCDGGEKPH
jgi:hypothetical protein